MSKCEYLVDISPYDPLCDHPCRLYGGGAVEAECETCQYRMEDLERENAKLRELVRAAYNCTNAGPSCLECRVVAGGCTLLSAMCELGIEVDE